VTPDSYVWFRNGPQPLAVDIRGGYRPQPVRERIEDQSVRYAAFRDLQSLDRPRAPLTSGRDLHDYIKASFEGKPAHTD
jgi:hypothetical protein